MNEGEIINGRVDQLLRRLEKLEARFEKECEKRNAAQSGTFARIVDIGSKIALPVAMLIGGALMNHETRLVRIENSDTHAWLRADVDEIKTILRGLDARLRVLESKVK